MWRQPTAIISYAAGSQSPKRDCTTVICVPASRVGQRDDDLRARARLVVLRDAQLRLGFLVDHCRGRIEAGEPVAALVARRLDRMLGEALPRGAAIDLSDERRLEVVRGHRSSGFG